MNELRDLERKQERLKVRNREMDRGVSGLVFLPCIFLPVSLTESLPP